MLRILGKDSRKVKSATMVTRSESGIETYEVLEDLSSWEFVNPSDDEQEDSYSFTDHTSSDDDDDDEIGDVKLTEEKEFQWPSPDISMASPSQVQISAPFKWPSPNISMASPSPVQISAPFLVSDLGVTYHHDDVQLVSDLGVAYHQDDVQEEKEEEEFDDEEEDDDDDGYGLDDELVPTWLSGKLGRQRIRKLGKRSRLNKSSNRSPCAFNKPGCVRGKHGLGVQHIYV